MHREFLWIFIASHILLPAGCEFEVQKPLPSRHETTSPHAPGPAMRPPIRLAEDLAGLHNVISVGDRIFSGSEPAGDEGFASLARLGVKTIVSVDGARPNVEAAHENGIQYVHIPIGYDGIAGKAQAALARVARKAEGPIYIHCHHGQHRGPAAAAIAGIAADCVNRQGALQILELAGTGREYAGLWHDVETYEATPSNAELPELVEIAEVESLTAAMARVDRHWDNLKLCRDANWQTPAGHRDLVASHEAVLLREAFREALRTAPTDRFDARFSQWLEDAERLAAQIETDSNGPNPEVSGAQLELLGEWCKRCHTGYRN